MEDGSRLVTTASCALELGEVKSSNDRALLQSFLEAELFTSPQFSASVAFEEHGRDGRKGIVIRNSETYSVGLPS